MRGADRIPRRAVRLLALAGILALLACHPILQPEPGSSPAGTPTVTAVTDTVMVTYTWTAPTTGTSPILYVVQTSDGRLLTTTRLAPNRDGKIRIPVAASDEPGFRIRVAGVDSLDRRGPWSEWSDRPGRPDVHRREEINE